MTMKAIITGGTGFIGRHLANLLAAEGLELIVPVRESSDTSNLPAGCHLVRASMTDLEPLIPYIETADYIFHLAGMTKSKRPERIYQINTESTLELARLCDENAIKLKRFVFISSQAASRPSEKPLCEGDECQPISHYGKSKLDAERRLAERFPNLPLTTIRPPSVYGPGDRDIFFYFQLGHKGILPIIGDPQRKISLVHCEDLARGIWLAAKESNEKGAIFYITDCRIVSWRELAINLRDAIEDISGKRPRIIRLPIATLWIAAFFNETFASINGKPALLSYDKVREISKQWISDSSKICNLGFEPKFDLPRGLRETYRWYLDNGWLK